VKRGDLVTAVTPGAYGKPRPYLVVQADVFTPTHDSVTLAPLTSTLVGAPLFRITVDPTPANRLHSVSQVMVDKLVTVPRSKLGPVIGALDAEVLPRVNRSLALWLGLG